MTIEKMIDEISKKFDEVSKEADKENIKKKQEAIFLPYKEDFEFDIRNRLARHYIRFLDEYFRFYEENFLVAVFGLILFKRRSIKITDVYLNSFFYSNASFFDKKFEKIVDSFFDHFGGDWIQLLKSHEGYLKYYKTDLYDSLTELQYSLVKEGVSYNQEAHEAQYEIIEKIMLGETGTAVKKKTFIKMYKLFYTVCAIHIFAFKDSTIQKEETSKEEENMACLLSSAVINYEFFFEDHEVTKIIPYSLRILFFNFLEHFCNVNNPLYSYVFSSAKDKVPLEEVLTFVEKYFDDALAKENMASY